METGKSMNKIELQKLVSAANKPNRERNRPKPPTPKEQVQQQFSPTVGSETTATGTTALTVKEVLRRIVT